METKERCNILNLKFLPVDWLVCVHRCLPLQTGEAVMAHRFSEYKPGRVIFPDVTMGCCSPNKAVPQPVISIDKLQDRGTFFVDPGRCICRTNHCRAHQTRRPVVNIIEGKKLTNMRASGSDAATTNIAPKVPWHWKNVWRHWFDECIEVTPTSSVCAKILNEEEKKETSKNQWIHKWHNDVVFQTEEPPFKVALPF